MTNVVDNAIEPLAVRLTQLLNIHPTYSVMPECDRQPALARAIGVELSTLESCFRESKQPYQELVEKLAFALDVSTSYILRGEVA